jgi:hypothetical protein
LHASTAHWRKWLTFTFWCDYQSTSRIANVVLTAALQQNSSVMATATLNITIAGGAVGGGGAAVALADAARQKGIKTHISVWDTCTPAIQVSQHWCQWYPEIKLLETTDLDIDPTWANTPVVLWLHTPVPDVDPPTDAQWYGWQPSACWRLRALWRLRQLPKALQQVFNMRAFSAPSGVLNTPAGYHRYKDWWVLGKSL